MSGSGRTRGDGFHVNRQGACCLKTSACYAVATTATRRPLKEGCRDVLCSDDRSVARCCTAKASAWRVVHWAPRLGLRRPWSGHVGANIPSKIPILSVLSCQAVMSLGDTWLGQGDAARDESQEEASGISARRFHQAFLGQGLRPLAD